MLIIIREESSFMPTTTITINDKEIIVKENNLERKLKYTENKIKDVGLAFSRIIKNWEEKYIGNKIVDDDIFYIVVIDKERKEYYIKNKYPVNWDKFILLRNKLLREEL